LLILDEATSALDMANEKLVQTAINSLQGETTLVVVAHRLSTVRNADQIIVLEAGKVVNNSNWEGLVSQSDGYLNSLLRSA
jgi:ABC-type multidrug transport system fused ATPase/permease subunit